jgi:penicillin-insensitive murein endopeptidase
MVPVVNGSGESVPLPTGFTNKFGYSLEFDANGDLKGLTIDFEAMAAHIAAVREAAEQAGVGIRRVIFDPELQRRLQTTAAWPKIRNLRFSERPSWVRHDEHYHMDFEVPCKPMSEWSG